ncbi:MAG: hypothetical protein ACLFNI_03340 [Natronomonas sp.]
MTDTLAVMVNRTGLHSLEVPETFEATGSFSIELRNYGEAAHVHIHLDDTLSSVASLDAVNHYIDAGETRTLSVDVVDGEHLPEDPLRGNLKVVTGHGQETRYVEVILEGAPETVRVDPSLSNPKPMGPDPSSPVLRALPVAVLGGVALILAIATVFASDGMAFVLGGFAMLAGIGCAVTAYYLLT